MKASAGIAKATHLRRRRRARRPAAAAVTITVYARGNLAAPVTLNVASSNGGTFSKTTLTIPAGANGQDSYTFTPAANAVTTLTYRSARRPAAAAAQGVFAGRPGGVRRDEPAPTRRMAIIAKYSACKWEHGRRLHRLHAAARPRPDGQLVRAVSDSGYGSSAGNAMEMLNWVEHGRPATAPWCRP